MLSRHPRVYSGISGTHCSGTSLFLLWPSHSSPLFPPPIPPPKTRSLCGGYNTPHTTDFSSPGCICSRSSDNHKYNKPALGSAFPTFRNYSILMPPGVKSEHFLLPSSWEPTFFTLPSGLYQSTSSTNQLNISHVNT